VTCGALRRLAVVRHQRQITVYFNRSRYLTLMFGACAGNPARQNFAGFAAKAFDYLRLLEVNKGDMFGAKPANLPAGREMPPALRPPAGHAAAARRHT